MNKPLQPTSQTVHRVEKSMDAMRRAIVRTREQLGEGLQLTRTQLEILLILRISPQNTSELARQLFLTGSAITQTVETLVRRGLVERHPDEHDRRIIRLHLSPTGQETTNHLRAFRHEFMQALVERLTPKETEALISITEKLTLLLEEKEQTSALSAKNP